jgi:endonuclease/exonuclease/phosphatase (EEP) superfamily protein YafD
MESNALRVVTWNVHQAPADSPAWNHLLSLVPDVALLQEVVALPDVVKATFDSRFERAIRRQGQPQRFGSAVLVKGKIVRPIPLTAAEAWVTAELIHFGGVVVPCEIEVKGARLAAISVHSPAWPVDRERLTDVSVGSVKLTQSPDVWVADLLLSALRSRDVLGPLIVGGDFNLCETFDAWKGGPRGNREYLDRMVALGFVECLRRVQGRLAPTFCKPGAREATAQIDHLFADGDLT